MYKTKFEADECAIRRTKMMVKGTNKLHNTWED